MRLPGRPQDCGPIVHFRQRDARGSLEREDRCPHCGRGLPPLSREEVAMMRAGLGLLDRVKQPRQRPVR